MSILRCWYEVLPSSVHAPLTPRTHPLHLSFIPLRPPTLFIFAPPHTFFCDVVASHVEWCHLCNTKHTWETFKTQVNSLILTFDAYATTAQHQRATCRTNFTVTTHSTERKHSTDKTHSAKKPHSTLSWFMLAFVSFHDEPWARCRFVLIRDQIKEAGEMKEVEDLQSNKKTQANLISW